MRTVGLRAGATVLTLAATLLSSAYVTAHLKNPAAPLQPTVVKAALPGGPTLGHSVHPGSGLPVTSPYPSRRASRSASLSGDRDQLQPVCRRAVTEPAP